MTSREVNARRDQPGIVSLAVSVTALMVVSTLTQFALSVLGPALVTEFDLSRSQFGALTTVHFAVAAFLSPGLGRWIDRLRARLAVSMLITVPAASMAGLAFSPAYGLLVTFAGMAGVAQAMGNPISNKLVADYIPIQHRGLVMGIKQSGVPISMLLAGALLPLLGITIGWRAAFGGTAALMIMGGTLSMLRIPPRVPSAAHHWDETPHVLRTNVMALSVYAFLMGAAGASVTTYLPLYAHEEVGVSTAVAGTLIGAVGAVGIGARIIAGYVADRVGNVIWVLNLIVVVATVAVMFLLLAPALGVGFVWLGTLLFGLSVAWNAIVMLAVVRLAGGRAAGETSGYVMAGFFGGSIVGPIAFGTVVDASEGYAIAWLLIILLLVITALALWVWQRKAGGMNYQSSTDRPS